MKFLYALARGTPAVRIEYLEACLAAGALVDATDFAVPLGVPRYHTMVNPTVCITHCIVPLWCIHHYFIIISSSFHHLFSLGYRYRC